MNDTGQTVAKETFGTSSDNERIVLVEDFGEEEEYKEEDQLLNAVEDYEERIEDPLEEEDYMLAESEVIHQDKSTEGKSTEDQFEIYEMMTENEEEIEQNEEVPQLCEVPPQSTETPATPTSVLTNKTVVDPDERYLMSCLPAFQRFTPQQKAYVRMGIERLFYEVEFENTSEPRSKKSRNS